MEIGLAVGSVPAALETGGTSLPLTAFVLASGVDDLVAGLRNLCSSPGQNHLTGKAAFVGGTVEALTGDKEAGELSGMGADLVAGFVGPAWLGKVTRAAKIARAERAVMNALTESGGNAPARVVEVGAAAEADWLYFSNAMSRNASRGGIPANPLVAGGSGSGGNLVHMTTPQNAALINAENLLRGNIYAGLASNASRSGWPLTARTGLPPGAQHVPIPIPAAGEAAFSRITPIGPFTAWQRATGQQYTARGILNLQTGEFTRLGINWNQVQWYALDVAVDGTIIFVEYSATRK